MTTTTTVSTTRFAVPDVSVEAVFAGWQAGHYDLPTQVIDGGARFLELVAKRDADRQAVQGAMHTRRGTLAERDGFEVAEDEAKQSRVAAGLALRHIETTIALQGDSIITDYLRVAHDAALQSVRDVAGDLEGIDLSDSASIARGGAAGAAAFLVVVAARSRLDALEAAKECVYSRQRLGGVLGNRDPHGGARTEGAFRDSPLWPDRIVAPASKAAKVRVGPPHPLTRTVWLAAEGQGWMPTHAEWEAAYRAWLTDPQRNRAQVGPVPRGARPTYVTTRGGRR